MSGSSASLRPSALSAARDGKKKHRAAHPFLLRLAIWNLFAASFPTLPICSSKSLRSNPFIRQWSHGSKPTGRTIWLRSFRPSPRPIGNRASSPSSLSPATSSVSGRGPIPPGASQSRLKAISLPRVCGLQSWSHAGTPSSPTACTAISSACCLAGRTWSSTTATESSRASSPAGRPAPRDSTRGCCRRPGMHPRRLCGRTLQRRPSTGTESDQPAPSV